ncbi:sugar kinase [Ancylobacter dichloromethanicus]|uniref:2-dehydro-3-deoxygluconokinase n=1 Tax=Ancylobacter dichloromethanicus TaxID=518825 RepID=A0A9W6J755_9HYPH|nr:sugar kinase [Ancylobacter dichloromethanicus]MBS7555385.1 sugar kinase [Ancylobacter dichloromethanicus]GLK70568.1 ketodeoxygluconokinase [Ancylobacter dichloromethanicus]
MAKVISIGEVMVELARGADGRFSQASGGDTFNTAVYLARAGIDVAYATALGDDPYSDAIHASAQGEGIDTRLMARLPGRTAGLYLIDTDPQGERTFTYWRDAAPARELFELPGWEAVCESLIEANLIYLSGVTLSLYSNAGLGRLLATLEFARERGTRIVFDGNFRPRNWQGDVARARAVYAEALKRTSIALPTFEDEATLWGDGSPTATAERLATFGVQEIVVKNGAEGALVVTGGAAQFVPIPQPVEPVDTTAAGDSFNAAYLAARLSGEAPAAAAEAGHLLAGRVIRHRGAILPRHANA